MTRIGFVQLEICLRAIEKSHAASITSSETFYDGVVQLAKHLARHDYTKWFHQFLALDVSLLSVKAHFLNTP